MPSNDWPANWPDPKDVEATVLSAVQKYGGQERQYISFRDSRTKKAIGSIKGNVHLNYLQE